MGVDGAPLKLRQERRPEDAHEARGNDDVRLGRGHRRGEFGVPLVAVGLHWHHGCADSGVFRPLDSGAHLVRHYQLNPVTRPLGVENRL